MRDNNDTDKKQFFEIKSKLSKKFNFPIIKFSLLKNNTKSVIIEDNARNSIIDNNTEKIVRSLIDKFAFFVILKKLFNINSLQFIFQIYYIYI